jgi:hypothetical protein
MWRWRNHLHLSQHQYQQRRRQSSKRPSLLLPRLLERRRRRARQLDLDLWPRSPSRAFWVKRERLERLERPRLDEDFSRHCLEVFSVTVCILSLRYLQDPPCSSSFFPQSYLLPLQSPSAENYHARWQSHLPRPTIAYRTMSDRGHSRRICSLGWFDRVKIVCRIKRRMSSEGHQALGCQDSRIDGQPSECRFRWLTRCPWPGPLSRLA